MLKADRLNCGEIWTSLVKYLIVAYRFHFSSPHVNMEHQEAMFSFSFGMVTLASIKGNSFDTPLFSFILNCLKLISIQAHSLLSSSRSKLNILPGRKNMNGRLKSSKLYLYQVI